jgi:hypothetical protein
MIFLARFAPATRIDRHPWSISQTQVTRMDWSGSSIASSGRAALPRQIDEMSGCCWYWSVRLSAWPSDVRRPLCRGSTALSFVSPGHAFPFAAQAISCAALRFCGYTCCVVRPILGVCAVQQIYIRCAARQRTMCSIRYNKNKIADLDGWICEGYAKRTICKPKNERGVFLRSFLLPPPPAAASMRTYASVQPAKLREI